MTYRTVLDTKEVNKTVELTLVKGLTLTKCKTVKVKIIPPWVWHPSVGINGTKEHNVSIDWFKENGFLWEVWINNELFMVGHDVASLLLSLVFMTKGGR